MNHCHIKWSICAYCFLCLWACQTEADKSTEAQRIAAERYTNLDKNSVDTYPQFEACDELENSVDCFYSNLHLLMKEKLMADTLQMEIKSKDSLVAQFTVHKNGQLSYDSIYYCARHMDKTVLDSVLKFRFSNLPKIDSALKQGTPVSSSYLLPIVVQPMQQPTGL